MFGVVSLTDNYQLINDKKDRIVFLMVIGIIFFFAFAKSPSLIPVFITLLSVIFFVFNFTYLVILFLILLPLKEIVQPEYLLPGHIQTIYIPAFLVMVKLIKMKNTKDIYNHNMFFIIKSFTLFILFYFIYINFKNVYFNLDFHIGWGHDTVELNYTKALRRSIKYIFYFVTIILFAYKTSNEKIFSIMKIVFFSLIIILFLSQIFSQILFQNGLTTKVLEESYLSSGGNRTSGLLGFGDVNSLGGVYVLILALYLYLLINYKIKIFSSWILFLLFGGILYTLSRGAFIGLFIVLLLVFPYSSTEIKLKYLAISFLLLLFFLMFYSTIIQIPIVKSLLYRFSLIKTNELSTDTTALRLGGWIYYMSYILSNPTVFLYGTKYVLLTSSIGYARVPHNIYITLLFNGGSIFLFIYIYLLIKIEKVFSKKINIILLPFLFMTFLLSDFAMPIMLILILVTIFSVNEIHKSRIIVKEKTF